MIAFTLNGKLISVDAPPERRLTDVLRLDLGLTGTKVGCEAGDCGACDPASHGAQRKCAHPPFIPSWINKR